MQDVSIISASRTIWRDSRASPRFSWKERGTLLVGSSEFHCKTLNISLGGVGIQTLLMPQLIFDEDCKLCVDGLPHLQAHIKWRNDQMIGLAFIHRSKKHPAVIDLIKTLLPDEM